MRLGAWTAPDRPVLAAPHDLLQARKLTETLAISGDTHLAVDTILGTESTDDAFVCEFVAPGQPATRRRNTTRTCQS
jgi:hypothetical protein